MAWFTDTQQIIESLVINPFIRQVVRMAESHFVAVFACATASHTNLLNFFFPG